MVTKFYMGVIDIEHDRDIKRGIEYLQYYINNYDTEFMGKPLDEVTYYIGLGYYKMKNIKEARHHIEMSLKVNLLNDLSLKLSNTIKGLPKT